MKRRDFLKVLGVSGAGVATVGCGTTQADKLIPYVIPPEDIVPGTSTFYASTCRECPAGCGIQVETHEGRVTKVEGNPGHPVSHGNTCARGQASVQGLYHPDRYQGPMLIESDVGGTPRNVAWSIAEEQVAAQIYSAPRGSVVFLSGNYTGTMARLADEFTAAIGGRRVTYAPLEDAPRDLDFANADLIVAFGADFLETWGSPVDYAWQFAQMHAYRKGGVRGKFIWVGPHRPLTGLNADLWLNCKPGTEALVADALASGNAGAAAQAGIDARKLQTAIDWYRTARTPVAMGPGAALRSSGNTALEAAVARLNRGGGAAAPARPADMRPMVELIRQMAAGQVRVLLIDASDPVFTLPGGLKFAQALKKVPVRVSFSSFPDDTARMANFILPQSHFLESWDDHAPRAGVLNLVQPAMRPVFNTKQVGDVLLAVAARLNLALPGAAAGAKTYYDYLVANWAGRASGSAWRDALKAGGIFAASGGTAALPAGAAAATAPAGAQPAPVATTPVPTTPAPVAATAAPAGAAAAPIFEGTGEYVLVVYPSYRFFDGRNANRPWLLELPDPVTKVPWDMWVEVHPNTAKKLGVVQGDVLEVKSPHGAIQLPAYIWPGVREDAVAIQMGMGHEGFGRWTAGRGANPMKLLGGAVDPASGAFVHYGVRVSLRATGEGAGPRFQGLYENGVRIQHDREVAQAVSLAAITQADAQGPGAIPGSEHEIEELKGNGGFKPVPTRTDPAGGYPTPGSEYGQYIPGDTRWAMVMDLARCIGCSACTVACYAENNIPVVGPSEYKRGRDLSWLRIERYFGVGQDEAEAYSDAATDDVRFVPMPCQHCSNAPCEPVCPVYAAYHTPDGLNGQVYNRCVGTRYCANNCPYKVRVFNWFTYQFETPLNWQLNPDVTVREKGVMEKCTFCVQRIHEGERRAAVEGRHVRDGEVVPACAQACPTQVITFGNIRDQNSAVARAATTNRGYRALEELNTQTAIVYLKKVTLHQPRNTSHEAEERAEMGGTENTPQAGVHPGGR
ncbi:molybdopterin dinucleotide binding domain-containing protein [Longimicrobium sp.]|uniref:molybdopterin dinucleotide binding domain-containing protein n=1 Tax=Longimicrobium sp. TaxID=2029185 RepID=UPI002C2F9F5F|nr:molybdopterin dinucleotide binding domain-containing protein [Longimicrobium sp.]HSU15573.1 molybdopterin dinucleotide binding domain-containing protein [Longimicrobium sp.]